MTRQPCEGRAALTANTRLSTFRMRPSRPDEGRGAVLTGDEAVRCDRHHSGPEHAARLAAYGSVSTHLSLLSDRRLGEAVAAAPLSDPASEAGPPSWRSGGPGSSSNVSP